MKNVAKTLSILAVFVLALPVPVALAEPSEHFAYAEKVDFAGAIWLSETEHSTTSLEIHVFDRDDRSTDSGPMNYKDPGIVLFYRHRESNPETGAVTETNYEGFSGGTGATFEFDRSLGAAEATFPLQLYGWTCTYPADDGPAGIAPAVECEDIGEPVVEAHIFWTGVGPITRDVFNNRSSDAPWFMGQSHLVQAIRDATADGTVAGDGLLLADGSATYAVLLRGKYHEQIVMPR